MLFHCLNCKSNSTSSILSARASYKKDIPGNHPTFGIIKKTDIPYINSWVFGPPICGNLSEVSPDELKEIHLMSDIEHLVDLQGLLSSLKSALELWEISKNLHELSKHSPLLHQKMIPFMSHVSCLFEHTNSDVSESEQHQKRLLDIVSLWGFQLHSVTGDGNCCFMAIAFSICSQRQQMELKMPQLFSEHNMESSASIEETARHLRRIAVKEWITNAGEYQHFLGEGHSVIEEAPRFLEQGYFYGPLGNTMVLAISNALGLPIIVFSSAAHYPVINIVPRVFKLSIPLYIAFNQAGAGHYDAVLFGPSLHLNDQKSKRCHCGKGAKDSTVERCKIVQFKYTSSIRCPCLLAGQPCSSICSCFNCANPQGVKPSCPITRCRERKKHAWNLKTVNSISYAKQHQEKILTGPRTLLEYLMTNVYSFGT